MRASPFLSLVAGALALLVTLGVYKFTIGMTDLYINILEKDATELLENAIIYLYIGLGGSILAMISGLFRGKIQLSLLIVSIIALYMGAGFLHLVAMILIGMAIIYNIKESKQEKQRQGVI